MGYISGCPRPPKADILCFFITVWLKMYKSISLPKYCTMDLKILLFFCNQTPVSADQEWNEIVFFQQYLAWMVTVITQRWGGGGNHHTPWWRRGRDGRERRGTRDESLKMAESDWDFSATRYDQYFSIFHSISLAQKQFSVCPHSGWNKIFLSRPLSVRLQFHSQARVTDVELFSLVTVVVCCY